MGNEILNSLQISSREKQSHERKENELPKTINSREVADMLGKEHSYVMEMIQGRTGKLGIIPVLENAKMAVSDYFIPSEYSVEGQSRKYPCYEVTKMGCELLGNKLQGERGILFSAKYVKRFNQLEEQQSKPLTPLEQLRIQYQALEQHDIEIKEVKGEVQDLKNNMPLFNVECDELQKEVKKIGVKMLGGKESPAYKDKSLRTKVYSDIQHQVKREFDVKSYKAIKRCQLYVARKIIQSYKLPFALEDEIKSFNNQISIDEVC